MTPNPARGSTALRWARAPLLIAAAWAGPFSANAAAAAGAPAVAHYEHIVLIIEENKSYTEIVGDQSVAPNINRLAKEYGLATQFYEIGRAHV